jgi:hypothetical protein
MIGGGFRPAPLPTYFEEYQMKTIVTKAFKCAPQGHTTINISVGDEVEGRIAEIAIELGCVSKPSKSKKLSPMETK